MTMTPQEAMNVMEMAQNIQNLNTMVATLTARVEQLENMVAALTAGQSMSQGFPGPNQ